MAENATLQLSNITNIRFPEPFSLAGLDPYSADGQFRIGQFELQGADGAFAGVTTGKADLYSPEALARKEREKTETVLTLAQLQRDLEERIADLDQKIEKLDKEIEALQQENGVLNLQLSALQERADAIGIETSALRADIKDARLQYHNGLEAAGVFGPAAKEYLDNTVEASQNLIVIKGYLGAECSLQEYHVVMQDEHGEYFVNDKDGNPVYLDEIENLIGDVPLKDQIEYQRNVEGKHFGNEPGMAEHAQSFDENLLALMKEMQSGKKLAGFRQISAFYDDLRDKEFKLYELEKERLDVEQQIKDLEAKIAENNAAIDSKIALRDQYAAERAELQAQLDNLDQKTAALRQDFNDRSRVVVSNIGNFAERYAAMKEGGLDEAELAELNKGLPPEIAALLLRLQESQEDLAAAETQSQQIAALTETTLDLFAQHMTRFDQIQGPHGHDLTEFTDDAEARAFAAANPDASLAQAWNNPITYYGMPVYRDNETMELYTFKESQGERIEISDPQIVAAFNRMAYGQGRLFMNETPYSKDPNNGFIETMNKMQAEESTDKIEKAILASEDEGVEKILEEHAKLEEVKEQAQAHGITLENEVPRHENAGILAKDIFNPCAEGAPCPESPEEPVAQAKKLPDYSRLEGFYANRQTP